jgi:uncharacterized protein (DUF4213/DUF364 family)
MILSSLKDYVHEKALSRTVADVRIGLCYTAVLLDNGAAGVAYTFRHDIPPGRTCCFQRAGPLAGKKADEITQHITSPDLLERTVGIATANALININRDEFIEGDTLKQLKPGKDDVVGMVGYFGPIVPKLKAAVKELFIFEKVSGRSEEVYPEVKAFEMLPSCTVAIITSTTLINGTLGKLLEASKNCKKVALVGASTPLAKKVFGSFGIDILSGAIITDPPAILQIVSEGGGMRSFKGLIRKVNLVCNT